MNHSKSTRFLAMLLAVVMVIGYVPVSAFATENAEESASPKTATVCFDVNGGVGEYEDQVVTIGEKVAKPEQDPTYEPYEFAHWTTNLEENIAWNFEEDAVAEDMTLYAAWTAPIEAANEGDDEITTEDDDEITTEDDDEITTEGDDEITTEGDDEITTEGDDDTTTEAEPVKYTVNYYKWDWDVEDYVLMESEELTGMPGELTNAQEKAYEGCILEMDIEQVEILEDGTTVVAVYYIELLEEPGAWIKSDFYDTSVSGEYFKVISEKKYALAPGATETELILNNASGSDRKAVHVIEVDPNEPTIQILPGYYGIDMLDPDNLSDSTNWKTAGVTQTVAYYEETLGYNVVGAMNTALNYDSDAPYGFMVYNGVVLGTPDVHKGAQTYLAVTKQEDGTVKFELRNMSEALHGDEWQALPANFGWLVKDGRMTTTNGNRDDSDASRSMLGIKADGTLVICQVDGRNAPTSSGLSNYEMSEMMLALGCVWAINGDGGGSSSFVTKREGTTENIMRSKPSDGYERPTINSIIVISTKEADGTFDHAAIETDVQHVTPGSTVTFTATGVDAGGGPAEIPEGVIWQLADASMGTIENGVFTSNGTVGTAVVQMVCGNEIVGEGSVEVINPTAISFTQANYVVPYGKYIDFTVKATINDGQIEITLKDGDITFEISTTDVGTIDGKRFTAVEMAGDVTSATVIATYTYGDVTLTATAPLSLGKGSEVVEDYESYEVGEQIYGYINAHSYGAGDSYVEVVDSSNGKVRNGEKALAIHVDGTEYRYYSTFSQNRISDINKDGIGANGDRPIAMGAWVYIPEEATGLYLGIRARKPGTTKTAFTKYLTPNQEYTGTLERPGWYYLTVDMTDVNYEFDLYSFELFLYETDGGVYSEVELDKEHNLLGKYTIYIDDITLDYSSAVEDREIPEFDNIYIANDDAGVAMNGQTLTTNTIGVYAQVSDHAADNAVGLDLSSAKVYVDGIQVTSGFSCSTNGMLSLSGISLSAGAHTFRFEIADANGNVASIQRHVVVAGTASISIVSQDPNADDLLIGSTYWLDVKAAEIENVKQVTTILELDGVNDWQLNHMIVADGFTASYSVDAITNDATLTITRTGNVSATGEGVLVSIPIHTWEYEVWYNNKTQIDPSVTAVDWTVQNAWAHAVKLCADYGVVTYMDDSANTFAMAPLTVESEIGISDYRTEGGFSYHVHKVTAIADKEPTCIEEGYTGRTVCDGCLCHTDNHGNGAACTTSGCGSVINWGTTVPAKGHTYKLTEGVLTCECGATFTGIWEEDGKEYIDGIVVADGWQGDYYYVNGEKVTGIYAVEDVYYDFGEDGINQGEINGLFALNNKVYCAIVGKLVTGWQNVDNKWVYAAVSSKEVQTGEFSVSGLKYTADDEGFVIKGAWVTDAKGTKYSYGPSFYKREWVEIDGKTYYFGTDSYIYTGIRSIPVNRNNEKESSQWYEFAENGELVKEFTDYTGFLWENGTKYYVVNGLTSYGNVGVFLLDGDYYCLAYTGYVYTNCTVNVSNTHGLLPGGTYTFDEEGRIVGIKNGVCMDEADGLLYYYENGWKTFGGLLHLDTDGDGEADAYFYAISSGQVVCDKAYWITKTNDLLPAKKYTFGADGKMIDPPTVDPDIPVIPEDQKNGIVKETDGKLYYYENGKLAYGGLMLVDGDYYYATSAGEIICNRSYWISKTNDLLPEKKYTFGEDGKMIDPPTVDPDIPVIPEDQKNGIVKETDGKLYYYENGKLAYGGLMLVDGDYYYATSAGEIICSKAYWITKTNDLLPAKKYTFGEDGKMIDPPTVNPDEPAPEVPKNGLYTDADGNMYYYENGKLAYGGLMLIDGDYYYATSAGEIIRNRSYWISKTNDLLPEKKYTFGADGKMIDPPVVNPEEPAPETPKNGLYTDADGNMYYYENGKLAYGGLMLIDGDYYYATSAGEIIRNRTYWITKTNDLLPEKKYTFGTDGKMVNPPV